MSSQQLIAFPYRTTKVVQLIRHGHGFHNDLPDMAMYKQWVYEDAHLDKLGWAQAFAVRKHIHKQKIQPQLIVTSPLTRCLETTAGCFGSLYASNGTTAPTMMHATTELEERCTQQESIPMPGVPVIACELCRETLGVHPCDKRRSISEIKQQFPGVDFSGIEDDDDVLWKPDVRETAEDIKARAYKFAEWLMKRPEKHIAVVSHSGFLFALNQNFGQGMSKSVGQVLKLHFQNCEMRTIVLADPSGELNPQSMAKDPLFFQGGNTVPKPP